ncbi:hypothetical protein B0H13DRAFT_1865632 [Mycena leptocephala]|nr:hypothetical protein B0H13DRAFT_1865632 [Mycena leptocephala]
MAANGAPALEGAHASPRLATGELIENEGRMFCFKNGIVRILWVELVEVVSNRVDDLYPILIVYAAILVRQRISVVLRFGHGSGMESQRTLRARSGRVQGKSETIYKKLFDHEKTREEKWCCALYFMKKKIDSLTIFRQWKRNVQPFFKEEMTEIRFSPNFLEFFQSDGGGEFMSAGFQSELAAGGTIHHTTDADTPEPDGRCERRSCQSSKVATFGS